MALTGAQEALVKQVEFRAMGLTAATSQPVPFNRENIYEELKDGIDALLRRAPRSVLMGVITDGSTNVNANKVVWNGRLVLPFPDDFVRFLAVETDAWRVLVTELLDTLDPRYKQQSNGYAQAEAHEPLAFEVSWPNTASGKAAEVFPGDATDVVTVFDYVATTAPEDAPVELKEPLLWDAASRALIHYAPDLAAIADAKYEKAIAALG